MDPLINDNQTADKPSRWSFLRQPLALWLAVVLIFISFIIGAAVGGRGNIVSDTKVIKGADTQLMMAEAKAAESAGLTAGNTATSTLPAYLKKDVDFQLYWDTLGIIHGKYYAQDIPDTKLFYGSLQGMVAALGDPYSVFLTPSDAQQFQEDLNGTFEGIGAEIAVKNSQLIIVSPLDDSPAMKAGLKPKDWILKINGTSTEGMSSQQAVNLIRGKAGTKVNLTIYREGWTEAQVIEITRAPIVVKSLTLEYLAGGAIAHIKVRQFNGDTMPLFDSAISNILSRPGLKGIILDLRNNPGGYLESAVEMAGEWNGDGIVVSEKNRDGVKTDHRAYAQPRLTDYKTIVLVDGGSASASEIVSGALKDWGKATLVGMKTFGKGSVQDLTDLPDGSQIKLTIAKWFTPNGISIDEQGIEPDVKVDLTEEDYNNDRDPQLVKALELLK
ncbi:MAG: S41 family peptidase [Patescibacteria group bacterium]|jgi:carboxyl-terminal processing protease